MKEKGDIIEGKPEYLIYSYNIITDAPTCDFYRFRNEVRRLMLNSPHPGELKVMLKPLKELCLEIVKIWNNDLYKLDSPREESDRYLAVRDRRLIVFDAKEMKIWHRNTQSDDDFYREPSLNFMNQDFAVYARDVANFISYEVLKETRAKQKATISYDEYKDFDNLFNSPERAKNCYELLINEQLIGPNYNYIGNLKSAFCIWVKEIQRAGLIVFVNNETYTRLLNNKFDGLHITESVFRSSLTKARKKYESTFRKAAGKLKQL